MKLWDSMRRRWRGRGRGARRERAAAASRCATRGSDSPTRYSYRLRQGLLFGLLLLASAGLIGRAVELELVDHPFLASQGDARFSRVAAIVAHRTTASESSPFT